MTNDSDKNRHAPERTSCATLRSTAEPAVLCVAQPHASHHYGRDDAKVSVCQAVSAVTCRATPPQVANGALQPFLTINVPYPCNVSFMLLLKCYAMLCDMC